MSPDKLEALVAQYKQDDKSKVIPIIIQNLSGSGIDFLSILTQQLENNYLIYYENVVIVFTISFITRIAYFIDVNIQSLWNE